MTETPENLHLRNRLLAALPPDHLAALEPHLRQVLLLVGDALHRPGDTIDQVYLLHGGVVSLMAVMANGNNGRDGKYWPRERHWYH